MKKNGFVSTSLIYTFFVIFLLLMLFLLNSYSRIRFLLEDYKYDIKNSFANASIADINIYFMVWNNRTSEYEVFEEMPRIGFTFESEFSYCKNGSTIRYQNGNIMVTSNKKDTCYAYFKEADKDVILNIYTRESNTSARKLVKNIPPANYIFTSYSCTNGATLSFNEITRKFTINSKKKTVCDVEFIKKEADIVFSFYKEDVNGTEKYNGKNYKETLEMPGSNYNYYNYKCENNTEIYLDDDLNIFANAIGKDKCKLYFNSNSGNVEIIKMIEADNGVSGYTTGKKYSQVYQIPSSGYAYVGYICDEGSATVTYQNGILSAESNVNTICRAYFNKFNTENALINYYLETSSGNYESVSSVPEYGYKFSRGECQYNSPYVVNHNYVEVSSVNNAEVCNFYYDQINSDMKVLVYVMNRDTQKYELGSIPVAGYEMYNAGCTNGASIEYVDSKLKVTSEGPTVCTVYFR